MNIDEQLSALEQSLEPKKAETETANEQENGKGSQLATLQDMTYEQTRENIKKVALVSTGKDENYVTELHDQSKDVLSESIALEKIKVEKEKQEIELEREKLATEKEKELNDRLKAKYGAKLDQQDYHFKSLQPILETFWIKKPMNIYVMWTIAILGCLTLIYPLKLLFSATFGNLIVGATSDSRKGLAKGAMWTTVAILGFAITAILIFGIVKLGLHLFRP